MRPPPLEHVTSAYERPNQPWVCGLAIDGQACAAGPTERGGCPALAECAPIRDGDRWLCNRAAVRGGPCEAGPTPEGACGCVPHCTPVRSLRARRGRFIMACSILSTAALVLMLSADWRNEVIAPGPLASQHAQLLRRAGQPPQCSACHPAAEGGLADWTATLAKGQGDRSSQSELCMNCHERTIQREFAFVAHNVPLKKGSGLFSPASAVNSPPLSPDKKRPDPFSCATCHREHHGAQFDLTAMDNAACQACHQQRYESFGTDHSDFHAWPYTRRTPIAFNHASHSAKHYREKNQSFDCRTCHVEDQAQAVQLLTGYEAACASCHDEKIATSIARGVPMFVLPTLDVDALSAAGHDVGPWPEGATGDFDGRLPPLMNLLLTADPAAAAAMAKLGDDFDFFDVDPKNRDQLAACAALAAAIKKLLAELSENGPAAIRQRLSTVFGRDVTDDEMNALVAGLSIDTLRPAARTWLGESKVESQVSRAGSNESAAGAWFRDDVTWSIRYRPAGHSDPLLTGWLTLLANLPDAEKRPLALATLKQWTHATSPGLCGSCHSVERTNSGGQTINWRATDRSTAPRPFTKFAHGPHLLLPEMADCTACHAIDERTDASKSYADWNPRLFVSEFRPLNKQTCATCHTAKAAGNRCQQCHNYHVGVEGLGFRVEGLGKFSHYPELSTLNSQPSRISSEIRPAPR
ncbi:MAG: hypothetical protein WD669_01150 [Pirellulales bacterium]